MPQASRLTKNKLQYVKDERAQVKKQSKSDFLVKLGQSCKINNTAISGNAKSQEIISGNMMTRYFAKRIRKCNKTIAESN